MTKVIIIHGFDGSPNGGWRPWLMGELAKLGVYAVALPMPDPTHPVCSEWVGEISRHSAYVKGDRIYLVGHSLGVSAILRYLEGPDASEISGAVLVSGPVAMTKNDYVNEFLQPAFDFEKILSKCRRFGVIHGDDDPNVPLSDARTLSRELHCPLNVIENGGHLNGVSGWLALPQCLEALDGMMEE
ncbi:MAG: serine hydrolase family protein [Candidatus Moranbacteria bacterium]|nr:serine hydrolase family protein [Candidatus Moranbacteria bacterium]